MKALTTMLADRAMAKVDAPSEGLKLCRDEAQAQIDQPVIDACLFSRPSSYATNKIASRTGLLATMLLRKHREIRAGGLPQHFLLAVTADQIIALRRTMKARGGALGEAGEEVARWQRSALRVTWKPGGYMFNVTLESPGEDEKIECCVGKSDLTEAFLTLLADPASHEAAAV